MQLRKLLLIAVLPVSACLFPALDDLGGPSDAAPEASDAAFDAAPDVPAPGSDAAPDADAGQGSPCGDASAHYFCADFDGLNPLAPWAAEYSKGSCTIDTADSHSAPASLSCQTMAVANGSSSARLLHPLPTTTSSAHVEFWIELDSAACGLTDPNGYLELFKLGSAYGMELKVRPGLFVLDVDQQSSLPMTPLPCGAWTLVTMDTVFSATAGSVDVAVNGVSQGSLQGIDTLAFSENTAFQFGLYSANFTDGGTVPAMAAHFDDLLVDVTQ